MRDKQGRRELAEQDTRLDELECARLVNEGAIEAQAQSIAALSGDVSLIYDHLDAIAARLAALEEVVLNRPGSEADALAQWAEHRDAGDEGMIE